MAKYVNTPQTLIYDKSRVLYGLSKAKLDIKKSDRCILVEGNMDALMSFQAGVRNVVASSGTALTPTHLRLLQRYTRNLGFCFDTDQAGAMATRRGIGLALAQQFNIHILEIKDPECKDPADYVKKYGSKWSDVVHGAKPVIDYYFDRARSSYNPTSAGSKTNIIAAVAPFIKRLGAHVERAHWMAQLAALLRVPESAVAADVMTFKDDLDSYARAGGEEIQPAAPSEGASLAQTEVERDAVHEMILSVALRNPALLRSDILALPPGLLEPRTMTVMRRIAEAPEPFEFKVFMAGFSGDDPSRPRSEADALQLEFAYLRSQELWQEFNDEELKAEFNTLTSMVRRRAISARLAALQFDVKEAESAKDQPRLAQLTTEFHELARQLTLIQNPYGSAEKIKKVSEAAKEEVSPIRQPADDQEAG